MTETPPTHVVIPDTQVKYGVPTAHLEWISRYVVDHFAGHPNLTMIHLGDHWDMPSLSSYDKGKKAMEGRRYLDDVAAGNAGFELLNSAFAKPIKKPRGTRLGPRTQPWKPKRRVRLLGNHEDRITRATEADAQLTELLSLNHLKSPGWDVVPFLVPEWIDGVAYAHYWANPMTGNPYGGQAATRLKTIGHTFTMGHIQTLDYALRFVAGRSQHALIAGACYLHDEDYKGPQGNAHWRGIVVCHQVEQGSYDPMFVSLDYLCRRYEGCKLVDYLKEVVSDDL